MAPLDEVQFRGRIATSPLQAKYGAAVDRQSAHEMLTGKLAAARAAAAEQPATAAGAPAAAAPGATTAAQRRELQRQQREIDREIARADREAERRRRAAEREAQAAERARQRTIDTSIRTAGRVLTSRTGQSILRGIFDTLRRGR
jgi:hypothetical protein